MNRPAAASMVAAALLIAASAARAGDEVKEHNACVIAEAAFLEAEDLHYAGLKERALEQYRKVLDLRPDHHGALRKVAELLNQQGKHGDAVNYVDRALKARPDYPGLNDLAGLIYRNAGNVAKSKEFFKRACDLGVAASCADLAQGKGAGGPAGPGSSQGFKVTAKEGTSDYHYQTGRNLQLQGKYDEALMQFEEAIVKDATNAGALEEAGYEWTMKGSHEKALEYYRRATAIAPRNATLWDKIGLSYKTAGELDAAADAFVRACKLGSQVSCGDAQQMGVAARRGAADTADLLALIRDGDLSKAEAGLRELVAESPDHFLVHHAYGELWLKKGDLGFALAHARRTVELNPSSGEGHWLLSRIYAAKKMKKESGDALQKACRLGQKAPGCPKK